jgi:thiamine monophosphate synthase
VHVGQEDLAVADARAIVGADAIVDWARRVIEARPAA